MSLTVDIRRLHGKEGKVRTGSCSSLLSSLVDTEANELTKTTANYACERIFVLFFFTQTSGEELGYIAVKRNEYVN